MKNMFRGLLTGNEEALQNPVSQDKADKRII